MELNLSEIFYSLQGEGPHTGVPVVFVRFSGCNLRCKWGDNLCDTPYTSWTPETNLRDLTLILEEITRIAPQCRHVVLTGGEPTLQEGLAELCRVLKQRAYTIDIETNGLGPIPSDLDTIVCSPKLSDSTPYGTKYEKMHAEKRLLFSKDIRGEDPRIFLKFVVSSKTDIAEIHSIITRLQIPHNRVYLMPEGITPREVEANSKHAADLALQHRFNFSTRLHIFLWQGRRGY